jgi:phosphatidyl-myo-inositol dimannoside synthase
MMLLTTTIAGSGFGGVQMVNRLILAAARAAGLSGAVVTLTDPADADWLAEWPDGVCGRRSAARVVLGALRRRHHARGSVILVTHVALTPVGWLIKRLTGGKLYLFVHGNEVMGPIPWRRRWGLAACDAVFANSHFTLRAFRTANPRFRDLPGYVCYLPARPLGTKGAVVRDTAGPSPPRVLVVGRLWGRGLQKGQRELITVWPDILRAHPDAELWIVGDGDGRPGLEALARRLGVADAIHFPGALADAELGAAYAAATVFAMPSRREGFGLVFAEAMAHGLPCIASREDAGSEVVVHGQTGFHVDPDDPAELTRRLLQLLADPALRARLGDAGRRRAEQLFSLASFNRRIEEILRGRPLACAG